MKKTFVLLHFFLALIRLSLAQTDNKNNPTEYLPQNYQNLTDWQNGKQLNAFQAFKISCRRLLQKQHESENQIRICRQALTEKINSDRAARAFFEHYFSPFLVGANHKTTGFFTGYYEPTISGSRHYSSKFSVPLYQKPKALIVRRINGRRRYGQLIDGHFQPYYTRKEINKGDKLPESDVLFWLKSRIDRAFLQIQGSGRIKLTDGKSILVGYNGQNGRPYRPIGRYFIEKELITKDKLSMQTIKAWLKAHPKKTDTILNFDPSFVFFKILNHTAPLGSEGVPLTPGYSIAIDPAYHQYGTPIWLDTTYRTPENPEMPLQRLFIAQDSGGAIKGATRGDIFWGAGRLAEYIAGHMKHTGKMYVLLPK